MRVKFHLAFEVLAACHAFKLALLTLIFWVLCDFTEFFVHLSVFFNVWRDFDTFPVILDPFLNFWEVNKLRWVALAVRRVVVRVDVIESTRKLDFNFTFFLNHIFWMWTEGWTSCWNTRLLEVGREWRHAFLENLLAFLLSVPIATLAWRNFYKDLSGLLLV